ncbi:MAG: sugar ABC transporter ATP-binding protein [Vicinamibacteraceae bacterium]
MTEPGTTAAAAAPLVRLRGIGKRYAAPVLADIELSLQSGEIHALMGANGAGKSTLSKIVSGLIAPDSGAMHLAGEPYRPRNRRDAQRAGVQIVLQELNLIPTLSVAENLFLADLPHRVGVVATRALRTQAIAALRMVGLDTLDPDLPAGRLGVGQQQLVALAAAFAQPCRVLILDEPTAALTDAEIGRAFDHLRRLAASGTAILYISHRLEEIRRLCHRITILRDGRIVGERDASQASLDELVGLMVGEGVLARSTHASGATGAVALRVEGLTRGRLPRDVGFTVRHGEILGLAGLVGSGRSETLRAIVGADRPTAGRISRDDGPPLDIRSPRDAVRAGIGFVPEDRRTQGLCLTQSLRANLTLAVLPRLARGGWIDTRRENATAEAIREQFAIRSQSIDQPVAELSGGNQQKALIGRWLLRGADVLLIDEPTRGIDVGAKQTVHAALRDLAARGKALVVVSSELPELMALCDRIAVLSDGQLVATFDRRDFDEAAITAAAFSAYQASATGEARHPLAAPPSTPEAR